MNKLVLLFFSGVLFLTSPLTLAADTTPDPQQLINEMSIASRELNYDGVFMYRMGKQINTMRIIHKSGEDGVYEKLIALTGHPREVVRTNEEVKCYFPENNAVVVDESRLGRLVSSYLPNPIQSISDFYSFEIAGEGRVAGLDAWVVNIKPNDDYRYGYQLWIAKDSKLLLKSELKNQLGTALEQIIFAQISIVDEIDEKLLGPSFPTQDFTLYNNIQNDHLESVEQNKQWQATWLPAGFTISERARQMMMTSKIPVEHLVYSDGLAMVSVFVEKVSQEPDAKSGPTQFGGVNAYAKLVNGYQITAVGEVPKSTVKLMADSVKALN